MVDLVKISEFLLDEANTTHKLITTAIGKVLAEKYSLRRGFDFVYAKKAYNKDNKLESLVCFIFSL